MSYLTPRKRARALGSAHHGTLHHWRMTVTSVMLVGLVPALLLALGPVIGRPYDQVLAALHQPLRAIALGLALLVGLVHFRMGAQTMIEDYAQGVVRKALLLSMVMLTYAILATALFAVLRLAL